MMWVLGLLGPEVAYVRVEMSRGWALKLMARMMARRKMRSRRQRDFLSVIGLGWR